jgi:3-hydroxyacyl-CoA dehydrogenase
MPARVSAKVRAAALALKTSREQRRRLMSAFSPKKVAVLGAGVMGRQIACDLGDKGFAVTLFDLPGYAQKAMASAVKDGLCSLAGARRVVAVDNTPENHRLLGEADWIVEAVFEDKRVKDEINQIIATHAKPECIVTTNTSGIGINEMAEAQSDEFRRTYGLSHFFNPVKALGLLEVCPVDGTEPDAYQAFCAFAETVIGKTVVQVRDTPNFVGNRIGGLCLFLPMRLDTAGLNVLDIDRTCLCTVGWEPLKTWDIVGLPLAGPVGGNVYDRAPNDPLREWWNPENPQIQTLIDAGFIGRKGRSRSGFLGMVKRKKVMYDFDKGEYVPAVLSEYPSLAAAMAPDTRGLKKMEVMLSDEYDDPAATFAKNFFYTTLAYSLSMVGEICDHITDIDTALKHGFNWPMGVFERAQQIGVEKCLDGIEQAGCSRLVPDWARDLARSGSQLYDMKTGTFYSWSTGTMENLPTVDGGVYPQVIKRAEGKTLFANDDAAVLDISDEDGPVCLVDITARALGPGPMEAGHRAIDWAEKEGAAVVFGNTGPHFGFGANLSLIHKWSEEADRDTISNLIRQGQEFMNRVEYSDCPTVAAIQGFCLGGNCELALASNRRVANAGVYMGQTELNVGVIPGWGGLMRLTRRVEKGLLPYYLWGPDMTVTALTEHLLEVWNLYSWIKTSRDAYHAQELGFLEADDVIVPAQGLGQPYVLKRAKEVAQSMLMAGFTPPTPFVFNLPGREGLSKMKTIAELGCMQDWYPVKHPEHNTKCSIQAARVLCGGDDNSLGNEVGEQTLLDLEHEGFMNLVMEPEARDYMAKIIGK